MAKRISQVQRVLSTDIAKLEKMERAELAKEVSILASAGNKRIKRLQQAGYNTPALRYTMRHGGNFSVKGKDKDALLEEFKRVKGFLNAKTSSVRGAKQSIKEFNENMNKLNPDDKKHELTNEEIETFWEAVDRIREEKPVTFNEQCLQYIGKIEKYVERGRTPNQIKSYIKKALEKIEEKAIAKQSAIDKEIDKYISMGENTLNENHL